MVRPSSRSSSDKDPKPKTRPSLGGLRIKYLDRLASLISFLSASSTKLSALRPRSFKSQLTSRWSPVSPADASLMRQLGAEGVFVGSGIFKSGNPEQRAKAIVKAVQNYDKPKIIAQVSENLGEAMVGINEDEIEIIMAERGI